MPRPDVPLLSTVQELDAGPKAKECVSGATEYFSATLPMLMESCRSGVTRMRAVAAPPPPPTQEVSESPCGEGPPPPPHAVTSAASAPGGVRMRCVPGACTATLRLKGQRGASAMAWMATDPSPRPPTPTPGPNIVDVTEPGRAP